MAVSATFGQIEEFDGDRGVAAVRRDAGTFFHGEWKNRCRDKKRAVSVCHWTCHLQAAKKPRVSR